MNEDEERGILVSYVMTFKVEVTIFSGQYRPLYNINTLRFVEWFSFLLLQTPLFLFNIYK